MSFQQQQPQVPPPGWGPPPKKSHTVRNVLLIIAGVFVLFMVGCVALIGAGVNEAAKQGTKEGTISSSPAASQTTQATTETAEKKPVYDTPTTKDIHLAVKTLKKQCFGSAGCLVTYRVDATISAAAHLDPSKTYEVIYSVRGDESGPSVNTMTVTGDNYERDSEEIANTPSSKTKLVATVTSVEEQ